MSAPERITQKYLRRWPESKRARAWAGRMVHIETEHGVWRHRGKGYTWAGTPEAGVWSFEDAQREVSHCGPEKRATFIWVDSVKPRADLPPTLSAALAVPEVAALVDAAKVVHQSFWHDSDGVIRGMYDLERVLVALTPPADLVERLGEN